MNLNPDHSFNWAALLVYLAALVFHCLVLWWAAWQCERNRVAAVAADGLPGDETETCSKCGSGMVSETNGWRCPECRNFVEAE